MTRLMGSIAADNEGPDSLSFLLCHPSHDDFCPLHSVFSRIVPSTHKATSKERKKETLSLSRA